MGVVAVAGDVRHALGIYVPARSAPFATGDNRAENGWNIGRVVVGPTPRAGNKVTIYGVIANMLSNAGWANGSAKQTAICGLFTMRSRLWYVPKQRMIYCGLKDMQGMTVMRKLIRGRPAPRLIFKPSLMLNFLSFKLKQGDL